MAACAITPSSCSTSSVTAKGPYADAYYTRGVAYERLGQQKLAERDFVKAKELGYDP